MCASYGLSCRARAFKQSIEFAGIGAAVIDEFTMHLETETVKREIWFAQPEFGQSDRQLPPRHATPMGSGLAFCLIERASYK